MQPENQSELRQKFLLKRENVNAAIGSYLMCLCACLLQVIATDTLYQPLHFGQFLQKGWWPSCARLECNTISVSILCSNAISWMITIWKMVCDYPNAGSRLLNSRHRKLRRQGEKNRLGGKICRSDCISWRRTDAIRDDAGYAVTSARAPKPQQSAYVVAYINGMRTETASTLRRTLFSCPTLGVALFGLISTRYGYRSFPRTGQKSKHWMITISLMLKLPDAHMHEYILLQSTPLPDTQCALFRSKPL